MRVTACRTVFVDIVGNCNANCPYCNTGARRERSRGAMASGMFEKAIKKLLDAQAIDVESIIGLYNWGEPLLHPDLSGVVRVVNDMGLRYSLSTNGSTVLKGSSDLVRNLDHIIFSMPGFSQESYTRISGLKFDKVCDNIVSIAEHIRRNGFKGDALVVFHVYQFNLDEVKACGEFAARHGLLFRPQYAIMNEWRMLQGWLDGSLPIDQMRRISEDLFSFDVREKMSQAPKDYRCPQWDLLVLDEEANVIVCCQTPKNLEFQCGNIIRDDIESILRKKTKMAVCKDCVATGLAYYLNNSLGHPAFCEAEGRVDLMKRAVRAMIR